MIILSILIFKINNNDLTHFIILFLLTSLLISYIVNILEYSYQICETKAALANITELINKKSENLKHIPADNNIVIKNLSYSFDKHKDVLKNINLTIKKSNKVIVTGDSGSGKSTLFKIIKGYYKDYKGSITINNNEVYSLVINMQSPNEKKRYSFSTASRYALNIRSLPAKEEIIMIKVDFGK